MFFVILGIGKGFAQTNVYHPFPDSNAMWRWQACGGPPPVCGNYTGYLQGDTIISSVLYHKIYHDSILKGGIRNDHISKKTYFICLGAQAWQCPSHYPEKILYDFDAGIGDTIFWSTCGYKWVVTGIDSVLLMDGTYRKRFISSYGRIIEGIGSEGSPLCGPCDGMLCLDLLCFKQDTSYLISNTPSLYNPLFPYGCGPLTSLSEAGSSQQDVIISPNPSDGIIHLEWPRIGRSVTSVQVYNVFGEEVFPIFTWNQLLSLTLNIKGASSGMFFIKLRMSDGSVRVKKIVLQ